MNRAKPHLALACLCLVMTGCGPLTTYYKPDVSRARLETDILSCETKALKDAPIANVIRQNPPVYRPGQRLCHGGTCRTLPGYWVDGAIYTVDVNADLRGRIEQSCMEDKTYRQITLKRCPLETPLPGDRSASLPDLTANSCVIRTKSGQHVLTNAPTAP